MLAELSVADDPDDWRAAGFTVDDDGLCVIGHVRLFLRPQEDASGVIAWAFDGLGEVSTVDGVPTTSATGDPPVPWEHANGSTMIDHVVLASGDVARTRAALEAVGFDARRVREASPTMTQVFFRAGEVIIELVGPPAPAPDRRTALFGIAVNVSDLDATKASLGDRLGQPKDAVQPGRRIATLRTRDLGIGTPIAFMSEDSR